MICRLQHLSLRLRIFFAAIPLALGTRSLLRLRPAMVKATRFLLHRDSVTAQLAVRPVMAKADPSVGFVLQATGTAFHPVFVAASFGARSSPATDLFAVVPFRCPTCFATADLATAAADPSGFAGFVAVAVADPSDLSVAAGRPSSAVVVDPACLAAADSSAVAVLDPVSADFAVSAADLVCPVYPFAEGWEKERVVVLASCFLTRRFSF